MSSYSKKNLKRIAHIIGLFVTKEPALEQVADIDTDNHPKFQDWVCDHIKPDYEYMTGDAIINSAIELALSGEVNGND